MSDDQARVDGIEYLRQMAVQAAAMAVQAAAMAEQLAGQHRSGTLNLSGEGSVTLHGSAARTYAAAPAGTVHGASGTAELSLTSTGDVTVIKGPWVDAALVKRVAKWAGPPASGAAGFVASAIFSEPLGVLEAAISSGSHEVWQALAELAQAVAEQLSR